ncbi:MAG: dihydrofolate reductase family protein [Methanoregulaceae archaeon]|nr:dihydrofolate reductase family protein [Methanoregulaceae archaeon]
MSIYADLQWPTPPADRPYVFMNMVSTIDGKILTGERDEPVMDLGSPLDHATMRYLESQADAVLIGSGSLRATPGIWYERSLKRVVMTRSGDLPWHSRFFTDAPEMAYVAGGDLPLPDQVRRLPSEPADVLGALREDGVQRLLIEGGSEINAVFLAADLVDELFLTVAPKVKLGREVPTIADGEPLTRAQVKSWELVSCLTQGSEVFLRYRRGVR